MLSSSICTVPVTPAGLFSAHPTEVIQLEPFTNYLPLEGTTAGTGFNAIESASGRNVEIRYLPWLRLNQEGRNAFQAQLHLQSVLKSQARQLVESMLSGETPRIVHTDVGSKSFDSIKDHASAVELLQLSANLMDTVSRALTARLYHGSLSSQSIRIVCTPTPYCILDYLEPFYSPDRFALATDDAYHRDLSSTLQIVTSWLKPLLLFQDIHHTISPRKLSILRQLLQLRIDRASLDDVWNQWTDFLSDWLVEVHEPTGSCNQLHTNGQNTAEVEVFKNWVRNQVPVGLDEGNTCEVNVNPSAMDSERMKCTDGTDVIDVEPIVDLSADRSKKVTIASVAQGTVLGRFRLDAIVGKGGMGEVYRGIDLTNDTTVAIKVLLYNGSDITQAVRRFKKEARILASVQNEFVTQLFEVGFDKGLHYLAMEFVDGINLKEWMRDHAPLQESTALHLVSDIAKALVGAHDRQIIHRDIKPDNVLMAKREEGQHGEFAKLDIVDLKVKLTDFGIARQIQQSSSMEVTRAGAFLGTPLYMSPEQCKGNGQLGPTADIYALGITLFELLTGEPPFSVCGSDEVGGDALL